ncbi:polysaccharide deacetylase family protein [Lentibacillus salinarum]|uniref:Polysaccharide deacetylase family protein n=1 Tax=Lentibacillus salinarum TaxID=446820 RepID=A0ABW3ZS91_9BACI
MRKKRAGTLVISLDFELFWGVHDVFEKKEYEANVKGAHEAVLTILEKFHAHQIHATWAIVGMMYFNNVNELTKSIPEQKPTYIQKYLSPYVYLAANPINDHDNCLFFAPYLIEKIQSTPKQEMATHTFSHYYTLEKGQTKEQFRTDLQLAMEISKANGSDVKSIVFPRNQINQDYLKACRKLGLLTYRGNEESWVYRLRSNERRRYLKRGLRFLDRYVNLFGHQTYTLPEVNNDMPMNIKSSRFLTPYSRRLKLLEGLRLHRIKMDMKHAAKKGEIYHLWWHPHNFGIDTKRNIKFLEELLEYFWFLKKTYAFRSRTMGELAIE